MEKFSDTGGGPEVRTLENSNDKTILYALEEVQNTAAESSAASDTYVSESSNDCDTEMEESDDEDKFSYYPLSM